MSLSSILLPLVASAIVASGAPDAQPETLTLEPLIAEVLRTNQDLEALGADARALRERAVASGAMPDPSIGVAVRSLPIPSFSFTEDMMTTSELMVRQRLPLFGKRGLRREAAGKAADVTDAQAASESLALVEATTAAYAELWLVHASREVVERQAESLRRLEALVRGRMAAGGGRQADLLRAEVELARIRLPWLELEEREVAARASLAALLSRSDAVTGTPVLPRLGDLPSEAELLEGLRGHPELKAWEVLEEKARLEARLALKERLPDPEVGFTYGVRVGAPDMIGAEVSIPIPLFAGSNQDRLAAASRAEAEAASRRRKARQDALAAEIRSALASVLREEGRLRLYDFELLPRSRRSVEAARGAYQTGGVDFLSVVDAELQRHAQELEALEARAALLRERGRLARAAGSLQTLFTASSKDAHDE